MEETWLNDFQEIAISGSCRTAIDIGANCGEWTKWMLENFDLVIAIEPDPRAYQELIKIKSNKLVAINCAVSDKNGEAILYSRSSPLQSSLLSTHPIGTGNDRDLPIEKEYTVKTIKMDDIIDDYSDTIDFVKVDIEGAESLVLSASEDSRWINTRFLIECHDTEKSILDFFRRIGFKKAKQKKHPHANAHPKHMWFMAAKCIDEEPNTEQ